MMLGDKVNKACMNLSGFALLAAMLFYVSGAGLWVHNQLAHAGGIEHRDASVACGGAHHSSHAPSPADDTPGSPVPPESEDCGVCDLLLGTARSALIAESDPPLIPLVVSLVTPIPADAPAVRSPISHISLRGPPALG